MCRAEAVRRSVAPLVTWLSSKLTHTGRSVFTRNKMAFRIILGLSLLALASAAPAQEEVFRYASESGDQEHHMSLDLSEGVPHYSGGWTFEAGDGVVRELTYKADHMGFQPEADYLPKKIAETEEVQEAKATFRTLYDKHVAEVKKAQEKVAKEDEEAVSVERRRRDSPDDMKVDLPEDVEDQLMVESREAPVVSVKVEKVAEDKEQKVDTPHLYPYYYLNSYPSKFHMKYVYPVAQKKAEKVKVQQPYYYQHWRYPHYYYPQLVPLTQPMLIPQHPAVPSPMQPVQAEEAAAEEAPAAVQEVLRDESMPEKPMETESETVMEPMEPTMTEAEEETMPVMEEKPVEKPVEQIPTLGQQHLMPLAPGFTHFYQPVRVFNPFFMPLVVPQAQTRIEAPESDDGYVPMIPEASQDGALTL